MCARKRGACIGWEFVLKTKRKSVIKAGSQCEKCIRPSDCDDDDGAGDNEEKRGGGGGGGPLRRKHTSMIAIALDIMDDAPKLSRAGPLRHRLTQSI